LIFNPGPIGDGWTVSQGIGVIERGTVNGTPHSGSQLFYLDGAFDLNTLSQTIPTTPGQTYAISFWVADTYTNLLQVTFAGQTLFNGVAPATGFDLPTYVLETFNAQAVSTTSTLAFTGQWTTGSGTLLDDISIEAVPEPSAISLMLGAAAVWISVRRRAVPSIL
jgi:hypothetical protein